MKPVNIVIVGAGNRGTAYAQFAARHPERAQIVGVAEPREFYRNALGDQFDLPQEKRYRDWKDLTETAKFADAVIIATQDQMHTEPAVALADMGYDMLLEKPMAPTEAECRRIVEAVKRNRIIVSVAHVLRYTPYTRKLMDLLKSGIIGDLIGIQHLEPVGYWHYAHSYVRGNWRREEQATFMLMAKSCHDLDWIRYVANSPCRSLSSFGSLTHFRPENQPEGASDRCVTCAVQSECPYSALQIYLDRVKNGDTGWPTEVLTPDVSENGVMQALKSGPYGRCVYTSDNDVVDHQVVNMEFQNQIAATFTMVAFTRADHRRTRLFGTRGELYGDGHHIEWLDFLTDEPHSVSLTESDGTLLGGHGGGDYALMDAFVQAVAEQNPGLILSGPDETLESHLMVFAAERARREARVTQL